MIPLRDMYYPFEAFYHIMPFSYFCRSAVYEFISNTKFEPCENQPWAVCVNSSSGEDVLDAMSRVMPLLESENSVAIDLIVLVAIGAFYKVMYIAGVAYKSHQVSKFHAPDGK